MTTGKSNNTGPITPLITFVGYTRNDGYAENFEKRLLLTVLSLADQARRFEIAVELLLVEWNPPNDRPAVASVLEPVDTNPFFQGRIVQVPAQYHQGFRGANEKGLHPIRALNVGYRRAKGKFVTPIASDVFLSDNIFAYVKKHGLQEASVYRLDRIDVQDDFLTELTVVPFERAVLDQAVVGAELHRHAPLDGDMAYHYGMLPLHTNASGDFLLMARSRWHALGGQPENLDVACLDADSIALHAAVASGLVEKRLPDACVVYKLAHGEMSRHRVRPYRPKGRYMLERVINKLIPHRPTQALIRALFDVPRRRVGRLEGHFVSMERNLVLPARIWARRKKQVRLSGEGWGLKGVDLPEATL